MNCHSQNAHAPGFYWDLRSLVFIVLRQTRLHFQVWLNLVYVHLKTQSLSRCSMSLWCAKLSFWFQRVRMVNTLNLQSLLLAMTELWNVQSHGRRWGCWCAGAREQLLVEVRVPARRARGSFPWRTEEGSRDRESEERFWPCLQRYGNGSWSSADAVGSACWFGKVRRERASQRTVLIDDRCTVRTPTVSAMRRKRAPQ